MFVEEVPPTSYLHVVKFKYEFDVLNHSLIPLVRRLVGKLRLPFGATGGKGFILAGPVGKTSPWEVNQSEGFPLLFSQLVS